MDGRSTSSRVSIRSVRAAAYTVPTDYPEADGTYEWRATTIVVAHAVAGGAEGLGYTYADKSAAALIKDVLAPSIEGQDAMATGRLWSGMIGAVRNIGRPGLCSAAIAALDVALWDLKARLLDLPLATLLGAVRDSVPIYGSGGFTSYPIDRLQRQLRDWREAGIRQVKMKVGSQPAKDAERVAAAREAIGAETALFVDANGAYGRKQALALADAFARHGVVWFEEPVSSDDLTGLRLLRDRAPSGMDIAAGEYGYDAFYFRRMLEADCVDVLQADATRCGGITGFLQAAALCQAHGMPLSAHTAPALHLHVACAATPLRHIEYFHDHVRIEKLLFDGCQEPVEGALSPDLSRPGMGLALRAEEASRYAA